MCFFNVVVVVGSNSSLKLLLKLRFKIKEQKAIHKLDACLALVCTKPNQPTA